ncbi:T9SS type A sorting domain-containing protein [Fluviicola chungangensis]|nr:T9SS type A sorting domain-containing protein [Fluviicola chungangensis]
MKRILLSLSMGLLCFWGSAQRLLDLQLTITAPQNGDTIEAEVPFNFVVNVKNADSVESLEATDSVYYYFILFGDTTVFAQNNQNHLDYTGNSLIPMQSFDIPRIIGFSDQFVGMTVDVCVYVKPENAQNPIEDPDQSNNMDCITVHVTSNNLSVSTHELSTVKIGPNPANDHFSLIGADENSVVSVMDLQGNRVDFNRDNGEKIDCSNWKNGVYLLNITNDLGTIVRKLIVSH